ncbi:MAG TPA: phosphotransferase [Acidimicrobiales bacterium]
MLRRRWDGGIQIFMAWVVPRVGVDNESMEERPTSCRRTSQRAAMSAMPPDLTLAWLLGALDVAEVVNIEPMRGSSTSELHRVTVRSAGDAQMRVVVRRYVLADVLAESLDIVSHEVKALRLAASAAVPTPTVLAADAPGEQADVPTVIMSWLEGRPRWESKDRRRFLIDLVDAMIAVSAVKVPSDVSVRPISGYTQNSYDPPRWATRPVVWRRAVEIFHGPTPITDLCFVHRDFHPGNVLWNRSQLTGLVDWQSACIGPSSIEPGHCRLNMLYYDPDMAEELRTIWEQRAQRIYDPWADVIAIVGMLDPMRKPKNPSKSRMAIEDTLARAVADLSG